ncbi:hypothetical protein [Pseudomonas sp. DSP3-2-2]|uniref:hypothetical protein n=1 Tax=unclassified Pseudomonas TaxID=196821 RepID=UPI003CE9ACBB
MNVVKPEVELSSKDMAILDRVGRNAGTTGESLLRDIFKKVIGALEDAQKATDPVHGSPAANVFPIRPEAKKWVPD